MRGARLAFATGLLVSALAGAAAQACSVETEFYRSPGDTAFVEAEVTEVRRLWQWRNLPGSYERPLFNYVAKARPVRLLHGSSMPRSLPSYRWTPTFYKDEVCGFSAQSLKEGTRYVYQLGRSGRAIELIDVLPVGAGRVLAREYAKAELKVR